MRARVVAEGDVRYSDGLYFQDGRDGVQVAHGVGEGFRVDGQNLGLTQKLSHDYEALVTKSGTGGVTLELVDPDGDYENNAGRLQVWLFG